MAYKFDFGFLWDTWPDFLDGALLTLGLSTAAIVLGFMLGTVCAIARTGPNRVARAIVTGYVEIIRNTPLLVQTFWLFFGLASIGLRMTAFQAAILALTINVGAYTCEIVRAGIESIHKGQIEAGESLGLSRWSQLRDVILPPAIERVVPALGSQFILIMLASSIMAQISAEELMAAASRVQSDTFRGFEIYIVVACMYVVPSWLLRIVFEMIALRLSVRVADPSSLAKDKSASSPHLNVLSPGSIPFCRLAAAAASDTSALSTACAPMLSAVPRPMPHEKMVMGCRV